MSVKFLQIAKEAIPEIASEEPCYSHNPALWYAFCGIKGRDPNEPNYVWAEIDVVRAIEAIEIIENMEKLENTGAVYESEIKSGQANLINGPAFNDTP
jgi:hypothetical protein